MAFIHSIVRKEKGAKKKSVLWFLKHFKEYEMTRVLQTIPFLRQLIGCRDAFNAIMFIGLEIKSETE